ncbi:DUF2066 domain-containing protein [Vibrio panuliri]|uniref:DUF2066 domain-containing protein n=1 Tax=Vibrio panuliri TaxID=1381081 RepID=A0ABX3FB07_9VIBR|nr:DUF2066 domain-containing protein [Vibrio panuliri]KAB1453761.1 DUF2066 domain-containing protein [Vibrio panuliri]OLQ88834.1 hypothetical protein BIY20_12430 [Vibrio panuliri]
MRSIFLLALGLMGFPAMALTNVDLYQSQIVLDKSLEKPDAQARVKGMEEVIVRASGTSDAVQNPVIQKALKSNAQYIAQLSYGQQGEQQTLKMRFNGPQIDALLSQAQLPTWPAQRANILVWLVEETQSERAIAWEHSNSTTLGQMKAQANTRGLPLTIPVGDFNDVTGVNISDLWGGFALPVGQASQRYPADAVLVVRASNNNLRWTLYDQQPKTIGVTRQAPLSGSNNGVDAADKMINQISDYYAKQSSVVVASESSEAIQVRFTSLDNAVDFFVLERKLQQLSSVASLDILKIQGKQITFLVHLLATPAEFEQQVLRMREAKAIAVEPVQPVLVPQPQQDVSIVNEQGENEPAVEQALPEVIEQVEPKVVEPQPALMFEWQGGHYVAPAPTEVEEADVNDEMVETDIDA